MTRKEAIETAAKSSPLVAAVACLVMAVAVIVERTYGRENQSNAAPAEAAQIATLGTKLDAVIPMQEKNYERLGKIEEKIDPLGNRVTALEARVGGLERVWGEKQ